MNDVTCERARSFLTDDHIQRIVDAYRAFEDIPGFARVAPTDEVLEKDGNLSIPLYARAENVRANGSGDGATLQQSIAGWQTSSAAFRESMSDLFKTLGTGEQQDLRSPRLAGGDLAALDLPLQDPVLAGVEHLHSGDGISPLGTTRRT